MKLPLEATVAGGYRFLFGRIVSIIGTFWFPYLVLFGTLGLLIYTVLPHGLFHGDFSDANLVALLSPQVQAVRLLFTVMAWVVMAMVTAHLMRHALGLKQSTTFIHFSLAAPVWRMLVAFFLAVIILVVAILVMVFAGMAAGFAGANFLAKGPAIGAGILLGAIGFCLMIYMIARLFFFLPAVVVAEDKIGLGRAWELGKGNVLRIVAVWLCIAIPVWIVVLIILGATVLPVVISAISHLPTHPTPEQVRPLLWTALRLLPIVLPVGIVASIAVRGYLAGAMGAAYKAVTAPQEEHA